MCGWWVMEAILRIDVVGVFLRLWRHRRSFCVFARLKFFLIRWRVFLLFLLELVSVQVFHRKQECTSLQFRDFLGYFDVLNCFTPYFFLYDPFLLTRTTLFTLSLQVAKAKPFEVQTNFEIYWMFAIYFDIFAQELLLLVGGCRLCCQVASLTDFLLILFDVFLDFVPILILIKEKSMTIYHGYFLFTVPFIQINLDTNVANQRNIRVGVFVLFIKK